MNIIFIKIIVPKLNSSSFWSEIFNFKLHLISSLLFVLSIVFLYFGHKKWHKFNNTWLSHNVKTYLFNQILTLIGIFWWWCQYLMLALTPIATQLEVLTRSCIIVKANSRFMAVNMLVWCDLGEMSLHSNADNMHFQGLVKCAMVFDLVLMAIVSPSVEDLAGAGKVPSCSLGIWERNILECHQNTCLSMTVECIEGIIVL